MSHIRDDAKALTTRVRRIGGQLAAVERAIGADADCGQVLQQLAAIRGAVNGLILKLMEGHLATHVVEHGNARQKKELAPVLAVLQSYLK